MIASNPAATATTTTATTTATAGRTPDPSLRAALQALIDRGLPDSPDDPARDARLLQVRRDARLGSVEGTRELRVAGRVHADPGVVACFRERFHGDRYTLRSHRTFAITFYGFCPDRVRLIVDGVEHRARVNSKLLDRNSPAQQPHTGALVAVYCDALRWFHLELYAPAYASY
jgi:hypothetical protein